MLFLDKHKASKANEDTGMWKENKFLYQKHIGIKKRHEIQILSQVLDHSSFLSFYFWHFQESNLPLIQIERLVLPILKISTKLKKSVIV